ncbi:NAD(P)-binding protein [Laetiporus sulphureus 93-53]|uniref:NAD(P)-binding protein n=1 Tax=Laetiporus sulphureus 93-53 TaxID=1314785 RepID=A0A165EHR9_9APHY|nr:NAD(P)-binding protein [Laetiporus sulphureus 93-53]KZT07074.1 NAD(P)-binding protein [Laetiporus sulphureus 93-53]
MPSLEAARSSNADYAPPSPPVAIFVGGTSGIGRAMAETLARYTNGNVNIIIIGRNRAAAEAIIASFPPPPAGVQHEFVPCDANLMKNVESTTQGLLARLPKVNYLVLSSANLRFFGRGETSEGIDDLAVLMYYARWKFIHDLIPLLRKAKDAGEDAKVMSVAGPGLGNGIDLDDLGPKRNRGILNMRAQLSMYNDLMIEAFAERDPTMSFIHIWPGIVDTPILGRFFWFLFYFFSVSAEECAEYMLCALFTAGPGAHRMDNHGDDMGKERHYGSDEASQRLWEFTEGEIARAMNVA